MRMISRFGTFQNCVVELSLVTFSCRITRTFLMTRKWIIFVVQLSSIHLILHLTASPPGNVPLTTSAIFSNRFRSIIMYKFPKDMSLLFLCCSLLSLCASAATSFPRSSFGRLKTAVFNQNSVEILSDIAPSTLFGVRGGGLFGNSKDASEEK
jgi:hypothetical protein